jgi:hypothetical protein
MLISEYGAQLFLIFCRFAFSRASTSRATEYVNVGLSRPLEHPCDNMSTVSDYLFADRAYPTLFRSFPFAVPAPVDFGEGVARGGIENRSDSFALRQFRATERARAGTLGNRLGDLLFSGSIFSPAKRDAYENDDKYCQADKNCNLHW